MMNHRGVGDGPVRCLHSASWEAIDSCLCSQGELRVSSNVAEAPSTAFLHPLNAKVPRGDDDALTRHRCSPPHVCSDLIPNRHPRFIIISQLNMHCGDNAHLLSVVAEALLMVRGYTGVDMNIEV